MSSNKSNYCAISRTVAVVVTAILLISSIFSCNNLLSGTDSGDRPLNQKTGTVSGKFTFNGAIPQELIGKNTNSTNTKTAFPTVDETTCTYEITAYDSMNDKPYSNITATFNDNHTEYTLKGIPLDSPCTVEVSVFADSGKTKKILTGKNTFTLTEDNPVVSENIELSPLTTNDGKGTVKLNLNYQANTEANYIEISDQSFTVETDIENNKNIIVNPAYTPYNSGSYQITVSFWSGDQTNKGTLLYSFTETINIFDNLETNTWVKNSNGTNDDPHLKLRDGETLIADCIITEDMVKKFQTKTFYVDTTASSSSNTGTFSNPFTTLQAAVNHIITNGNTPDKYTIYIKNDITIPERILCITSNDAVRNITIAGYDGVKTITQENISNNSLFDFSKAGCNITLRDLILDVQSTKKTSSNGGAIKNAANLTLENVTIQNFISLREGGTGGNGGAIYNNNSGYLILKNSKIDSCKCESADMAHGGAIFNMGTLELDDAVIVGCKTQADTADYESYGGGIYNAGTCKINKAIITGCYASSNSKNLAKGGAIYNTGSLTLGDSICNSDGSPDVIIGIGNYNGTEYSTPNEAFAGAGVFSGENGSTASFTMNRDCVIGKYNPDSAPTNDSYGNRSCSTSLLGNGGAGVWIYKTTLTINGGFISYNYAENTCPQDIGNSITGVGLYIGNYSPQPEINNLVISYNSASISDTTAPVAGVGLYAEKTVTLNNVKIENNSYVGTPQVKGKGLYATDYVTVTVKGTTYFGTDDDIYLDVDSDNDKLKVSSTLNPQNTFGVPQQYVATITPGAYTDGLQVINGTNVGTEYKKFTVTPKSNSSEYWHIKNTGYLSNKIGTKEKTETLKVGDIVFIDGSSKPYSEGLVLSEEEKNTAIAVIFREGTGTDGDKTLGVGIIHGSTIRFASTANGCNTYFQDTVCDKDESSNDGNLSFTNSPNTDGSKNLKKMINTLGTNNDTGVVCNEDGSIDFEHSDQTTLAKNYPVFEFAYYYGKNNGHNIKSGSEYETGWYLPSASELNDMYLANKTENIIKQALQATAGINIENNNYISSSQESTYSYRNCLKGFVFGMGSTNFLGKKTNDLRPVCAVRAFD